MKSIEKLQTLLPLGYLFLVTLGIIKESVFFHQIGINILEYSSIMDILISPIATLTSNPIVLAAIIMMFAFYVYLPKLLYKHHHKKWVEKAFELKKIKEESLDEVTLKNRFVEIAIKNLCVILLSFFLGFGIAGGHYTSQRIKDNKLKYGYKLNYSTGESEIIYKIGSNSVYYFYVAKGSSLVKIVPVNAVKSIELIKNNIPKN